MNTFTRNLYTIPLSLPEILFNRRELAGAYGVILGRHAVSNKSLRGSNLFSSLVLLDEVYVYVVALFFR